MFINIYIHLNTLSLTKLMKMSQTMYYILSVHVYLTKYNLTKPNQKLRSKQIKLQKKPNPNVTNNMVSDFFNFFAK